MKEFVRQQMILFSESLSNKAYLIHDNAPMFNLDFLSYNLVSVRTAVEAPNMNSIMERFVRTVRREALDNFLIIRRAQIRKILEEYKAFYNNQRIPIPKEIPTDGVIRRIPVLGSLHHHYYREAA